MPMTETPAPAMPTPTESLIDPATLPTPRDGSGAGVADCASSRGADRTARPRRNGREGRNERIMAKPRMTSPASCRGDACLVVTAPCTRCQCGRPEEHRRRDEAASGLVQPPSDAHTVCAPRPRSTDWTGVFPLEDR